MARPPVGKKVLHTQISVEEHEFLRRMAGQQGMTVTMYLRSLIRSHMASQEQGPWLKETVPAGPGESAR